MEVVSYMKGKCQVMSCTRCVNVYIFVSCITDIFDLKMYAAVGRILICLVTVCYLQFVVSVETLFQLYGFPLILTTCLI